MMQKPNVREIVERCLTFGQDKRAHEKIAMELLNMWAEGWTQGYSQGYDDGMEDSELYHNEG